jgi:hypothetical protein
VNGLEETRIRKRLSRPDVPTSGVAFRPVPQSVQGCNALTHLGINAHLQVARRLDVFRSEPGTDDLLLSLGRIGTASDTPERNWSKLLQVAGSRHLHASVKARIL